MPCREVEEKQEDEHEGKFPLHEVHQASRLPSQGNLGHVSTETSLVLRETASAFVLLSYCTKLGFGW